MEINECLNYQKNFFINFNEAWIKHSDLSLYEQIDSTANNLRMDISEVPEYILAYDQKAQQELHDYLQSGLIKWLNNYIPFFQVNTNGIVMFGNWYHRERFGILDVWRRKIIQTDVKEQNIIPELEKYSSDPENYLNNRLKHLHNIIYDDANSLKLHIGEIEKNKENIEQNNDNNINEYIEDQDQKTHSSSSNRLSNFFASFIDDKPKDKEHIKNNIDINENNDLEKNIKELKDLKEKYNVALNNANKNYVDQERILKVQSAVINYEYQAIMNHFDSFNQFVNSLFKMPQKYMEYLKSQEGIK